MSGPGKRIRIEWLMGLLAVQWRRDVVASLMSGNDAQCFTTQQYLDCYVRDVNKGQRCLMDLELSRHHLRGLGGVREVGPDVWTADAEPGTVDRA